MSGRTSSPFVIAAFAIISVSAFGQVQSRPETAPASPARAVQPSRTSTPPVHDRAAADPASTAANLPPAEDKEQYPRPEIVVTRPTIAPAPWTLHEKILWAAYIVLAVLGYVGIFLALRTLKQIEHQAELGATVAQATLESAQAVLNETRSKARAERPWIAVTVETFLTLENSFKVLATNRGNSPAKIVSTIDRVLIAPNEMLLPKKPEYEESTSNTLHAPVLLLPGESVGIRTFSRSDVRLLAKSADALERIKDWRDKIFLYGRVTYVDLAAPQSKQTHETTWCCRYIHGEKSSALVLAGPPDYNQHT